jgi:uncharacterized protein YjbI with pentapeptide repeats
MSLNRQTLSAPSVGGGSTSPYVTIYDNASVTPQAALWTIVDGRVTQVGLDVRATTGTTAITTGQGLTFDGDFDLSPIGATLATWTSRNCTYDSFVSGACANLSFVDFYGALPSTVGSTIGTLDLSGCTNALVVWLGGPVTTAITLPSNLVELRIANVAATPMTFAALNVSGSDIATFFANYGDFTAGLNLSNCASLASINLDYCSFGTLDLTTLNLDTFNAGAAIFTSVDLSGMATLTSIVANASTFTSIDASGCSNLSSVNLTEATFTSADFSNCTGLAATILMDFTEGAFSLNLTNCSSLPEIRADNLSEVASMNVTGCAGLTGIYLPNVPNLTTVTLTTMPAGVVIAGAALNVASVNAILIAADANGALSGTMDLSGGTSAAPTGAGITAKNNLIAKGWIVATN